MALAGAAAHRPCFVMPIRLEGVHARSLHGFSCKSWLPCNHGSLILTQSVCARSCGLQAAQSCACCSLHSRAMAGIPAGEGQPARLCQSSRRRPALTWGVLHAAAGGQAAAGGRDGAAPPRAVRSHRKCGAQRQHRRPQPGAGRQPAALHHGGGTPLRLNLSTWLRWLLRQRWRPHSGWRPDAAPWPGMTDLTALQPLHMFDALCPQNIGRLIYSLA